MKNFNFVDVMKFYFNEKQIKKIIITKLLIIGCGGLGSNIANILIRTGYQRLILVDYDKVEIKNLNRQQFLPSDEGKYKVTALKSKLLLINPSAKIIAINKKLDKNSLKDIIKKYNIDITIEAVDKVDSKIMIFETLFSLKKILITASGIAGFGDVENIKIIRKKYYTIIGDLVSRCGCCNKCYPDKEGCNSRERLIKEGKCYMPLAPKVSVVAAMQADEVLRRTLIKESE